MNEAVSHREENGLRTVDDPELAEDIVDVGLYRRFRDYQPVGNVLVVESLAD